MKPTYYNEWDPYAAAWLRNLIAAGHLPAGDVDERSVRDVNPDDLRSYGSAHFFAGVGGWPLALRLAGWPGDRSVWTGSCPCQPYSAAGKRKGAADDRDLWPDFFRLIDTVRPAIVFGEQVASADVVGKAGGGSARTPAVWLDRIQADLEAAHYTVGACDLAAACVGAPHIRQRLWWVADSADARRPRAWKHGSGSPSFSARSAEHGDIMRAAHTVRSRLEEQSSESGNVGSEREAVERDCDAGGMGNTERRAGEPGWPTIRPAESTGAPRGRSHVESGRPSDLSFWSEFAAIPCLDGKVRRIGVRSQPLADGLSRVVGGVRSDIIWPLAIGEANRAAKLRAYGNAIVPQLAAEFIAAYLEVA